MLQDKFSNTTSETYLHVEYTRKSKSESCLSKFITRLDDWGIAKFDALSLSLNVAALLIWMSTLKLHNTLMFPNCELILITF